MSMKIVFSRKGFDSTKRYGGYPSPIINGVHLLSLPIPEDKKFTIQYGEIADPTLHLSSVGPIVEQLTGGKIKAECHAHLDPDIRKQAYPRTIEWRPLFGQCDQAQSLLRNQNVGRGDLFVFFGLYRDAALGREQDRRPNIAYVPTAPPKHLIWGWLTVGDIWNPHSETDVPKWARYHAHSTHMRAANNTIYVTADRVFGNCGGAGIFSTYHDDLCLTHIHGLKKSDIRPSFWKLPRWCAPKGNGVPFTYHPNRKSWKVKKDHVLLKTKSPAQEYVLDTAIYPQAFEWVRELITRHGTAWDEDTGSARA